VPAVAGAVAEAAEADRRRLPVRPRALRARLVRLRARERRVAVVRLAPLVPRLRLLLGPLVRLLGRARVVAAGVARVVVRSSSQARRPVAVVVAVADAVVPAAARMRSSWRRSRRSVARSMNCG